MKSISVILSLLFVASSDVIAQNLDFQMFARFQDSLMIKAYRDKSPGDYITALSRFDEKYKELSKEDKENFKIYRINSFYNLACTYSLLNEKKNAIKYLKKSLEAGYSNYAHILKDSDLDSIRNEGEFIKLMQPLRNIADYLYILEKAGRYNEQEKRELPHFGYQNADDANLVALRKEFNLDSIAGNASEVSRILNLMHWIHNLIPHDGNHENPVVKNAMSMIRECKREARGLNCRGMATVLNECYLALGYKSRFVTCLPKDSLGIDPDCHVINMVYSVQLKKWLWIDPTFDAYVMNEKGELLGAEEVRARLINNQPLILNPEANWNHKVSQTKENYLYSYMAKNLYMIECPVSSEYDAETEEEGKTISYIRLIPLDYFEKSTGKSTNTNNVSKTTTVTYPTNNPKFFWQAPY